MSEDPLPYRQEPKNLDQPPEASSQSNSRAGSPVSSEFHTPETGSSNSVAETGFDTPVSASRRKISSALSQKEGLDPDFLTSLPTTLRPNSRIESGDEADTRNLPGSRLPVELTSSVAYPHSSLAIQEFSKHQYLLEPVDSLPQIGLGSVANESSRRSFLSLGGNSAWELRNPSFTAVQTTLTGLPEKSSSPSGLSQSSAVSGMEWDPTADVSLGVGTINYQRRYPRYSNKIAENNNLSLGLGILPETDQSESRRTSSNEDLQERDHGSENDEDITQHSAPQGSNRSWKDSVSVEIGLNPRTKPQRPNPNGELGNRHPSIVDRGVQTRPSAGSNAGGSGSRLDRRSNHTEDHSRRLNSRQSSQNRKQPFDQYRPPRRHQPFSSSEETSRDTTAIGNSSILTPTCSFINHLASAGAPLNDPTLADAISAHRREHIVNVKRELRRVQALSRLLCGKDSASDVTPFSRSSSDELSIEKKNGIIFKPPTLVPVRKARSPQKQRATPKVPESGKSCECPSTSRNNTMSTACAHAREAKEDQKVDEIMRAFRQVLENFLPHAAPSARPVSRSTGPRSSGSCISADHIVHKIKVPEKVKCFPVKPPVAYFIPLAQGKLAVKQYRGHPHYDYEEGSASDKENQEEGEEGVYSSLPKISIQKVLAESRPKFLKQANERRQHIAQVREVRKKRATLTRNWIAQHGTEDMSQLESVLPTKGPRLMSSKEMRTQSKTKYLKLPEVQEKKLQRKAQQEKDTNRLLSSYFSGKLRQGVLKGKVNVDLDRSVIRK